MILRFQIFLVFTFCLLASAFTAQSVVGKILLDDGAPAAQALVLVKQSDFQTITASDGSFTLSNLPTGTQTLLIQLQDAETEKELFLEAGATVQLAITMPSKARHLDEVTISATKNANEKEVGIGKSGIRSMDLPQSTAVIERKILEAQQTLNLGDALKNFNGVYIMGNTGGVQQEIAARGFALGSSNTFKNGVRYNNAILPEMSTLEKVEILKGSAAILFGNVSAGGVLNLVTRKPQYKQSAELSMRFDSYNFYKPSLDVQGVLNKAGTAAFRIGTTYENAGSFRNSVSSERIYYNPSFAFKLGSKTELIIEGDYLKDRRTPDYGVGAINYALIDVPRSTFLGAAWASNITEQKSATATLKHRLHRAWQLNFVAATQQYNNELFTTVRPNANSQMIRTNGNWVRGVQRTQTDDQYYIGQLDLTGSFSTGFIKHKLLVGADADRYFTATTAYNNLNKYDSVNVFNLDLYQQRSDIPQLSKRTLTEVPIERAGVYLQDLVDFGKIKLLAGARFSYLQTGSRVQTYATNTFSISEQIDKATTPRLGIIYQPIKTISIFGSYANSFSPNTGVDINGNQLMPSYINQTEAGIKTSLLKHRLTANATVYQIVNSNLAQTSLENGNTNTNIKELAGEVTSQGLEIDLQANDLNHFSILAGYSYNETKYTKSNTYVVGSLLRYNPKHTANTSVYYTFANGKLKGLQLGSAFQYFGIRYAGRSTRVTVANDVYRLIEIPAYTTLDVSVAYRYKALAVRAKISNVLNALSYNVHDDNSINPIAPRQFATTITYSF